MPDLVSHALGGYVFKKATGERLPLLSLVLLGAILPDLVDKPLTLFFPTYQYYIIASHSLPVLICICAILSIFLTRPAPKLVFFSLLVGCISHLALDALQYNLQGIYYPYLAPFSYVQLGFPLFLSENFLAFIGLFGSLVLAILILEKISANKKRWALEFLLTLWGRRRIRRVWEQAEINRINRTGLVIPCPYCGSSESAYVSRWPISDQFGLFDNDPGRLQTIYALDLPSFMPRKLVLPYRNLAGQWISGKSHVDYRRCSHCDLVFQNYPHTPTAANYYYQHLYRLPYQKVDPKTGRVIFGRNDDRWVYQQQLIGEYFLGVTQLPPGSKVLDAGCGEGLVCKYFEDQGMAAYGIEPSQAMANYAQSVLQLANVSCGDYAPDSYPPQGFDGIVTHHVAEHVVDLPSFFKALARHLKIGGYLYLQVPCLDNLKNQADYDKILQSGHIYCFSQRFLRSLLESQGFSILSCRLTPCDLGELDPGEIAHWDTTVWADDPGGISILATKD